jgi:hypothetical protein
MIKEIIEAVTIPVMAKVRLSDGPLPVLCWPILC